MIKGFGYFALFLFFIFCSQIGGFSQGFAIWFLAVLTVASGTLAFSFLQFPKELDDGVLKQLLAFESIGSKKLIGELEQLASAIRRDGLLASESLRRDLKNPLMKYLLKRIMDGYEKVHLNQIVRNQMFRYQELFMIAKNFYEHCLQVIPVVGLVGSLFMIMDFLSTPKASAGSIAAVFVPFVVSLLGQQFVQALFQERLVVALDRCRLYYIILEEGMSGIQDGLNAELLRDKMLCRLGENPKWNET
jgi:flagellar motor component MotA